LQSTRAPADVAGDREPLQAVQAGRGEEITPGAGRIDATAQQRAQPAEHRRTGKTRGRLRIDAFEVDFLHGRLLADVLGGTQQLPGGGGDAGREAALEADVALA
jgi:hypothetical protein